MIYVDAPKYPFKRFVMCHLMADSLDELHAFAERLSLSKEWFQDDHYDISKSKRTQAIKMGALTVSSRYLVQLRKKIRDHSNTL